MTGLPSVLMRPLALILLVAGTWGCSTPGPPPARDAQEQRARDSALGASTLPGASGVRAALKASDAAAARKALADSAAAVP